MPILSINFTDKKSHWLNYTVPISGGYTYGIVKDCQSDYWSSTPIYRYARAFLNSFCGTTKNNYICPLELFKPHMIILLVILILVSLFVCCCFACAGCINCCTGASSSPQVTVISQAVPQIEYEKVWNYHISVVEINQHFNHEAELDVDLGSFVNHFAINERNNNAHNSIDKSIVPFNLIYWLIQQEWYPLHVFDRPFKNSSVAKRHSFFSDWICNV
jgi:hypothetical protein